jgi:hypothetical protein
MLSDKIHFTLENLAGEKEAHDSCLYVDTLAKSNAASACEFLSV